MHTVMSDLLTHCCIGLVQRYRAFLRCRQTAFTIECSVPTLVLLTPSAEGSMHGEAYRGSMQAEHVYEWLKRSFADSRRGIRDVKASPTALQAFLEPPWARRRSLRSESSKFGREPSKAIIFSSRAVADTLFARYIARRFGKHLDLGTIHVHGGLQGSSEGAKLSRSLGLTDLPAIVIWPDGSDTAKPVVLAVDSNSDVAQREELLLAIERVAAPTVPLLTPSNFFSSCAPASWDEDPRFCVLILVWNSILWADEAVAVLKLMREIGASGAAPFVRFAWVDAQRQLPFVQHLLGKASKAQGRSQGPTSLPAVLALRGASAGAGLRRVKIALQRHSLASLTSDVLLQWLEGLRDGGAWQPVRSGLPPLRAVEPPSIGTRLYVSFVYRGGWLLLLGCVGLAGVLAYYWPTLKQQWRERTSQQRQQSRAEPSCATDGKWQSASPSSEEPSSSAPASSPKCGVVQVGADNLLDVLSSASYVLIFVVNSGVADRSTMQKLIDYFSDSLMQDSVSSRSWSCVMLDMSREMANESKPALLSELLSTLRGSPCAVVRNRAQRKVVAYRGKASPRPVEEWIERLKMGELSWEHLGATTES
mmetsp:Transcript_64118/g.106586  ORF Transcript_64118/g.106586 Transcript_64118/m.106586 type:complete len:591 (+) Transcript_64118:629-2401(+)